MRHLLMAFLGSTAFAGAPPLAHQVALPVTFSSDVDAPVGTCLVGYGIENGARFGRIEIELLTRKFDEFPLRSPVLFGDTVGNTGRYVGTKLTLNYRGRRPLSHYELTITPDFSDPGELSFRLRSDDRPEVIVRCTDDHLNPARP